MRDTLQRLLVEERDAERWATERLRARTPAGTWEPGRHLVHFTRWRHRFADFVAAPGSELPDTDRVNAADLAEPLPRDGALVQAWADAFDRIEALLEDSSESDLRAPVGWYSAPNLGTALLRNSCNHPREHLLELAYDLGETPIAVRFARGLAAAVEDGEFRDADPRFAAAAQGLRAIAAALEGEQDRARAALDRARALRPELAQAITSDQRWGRLLGSRP
jgi:hypothetical protein